ncbi:MAG TPA: alkaline phosphatase family protein [Terriglobales bacterium]|nr:alkaline phosphatase family protein [Terriglobales bacterium]
MQSSRFRKLVLAVVCLFTVSLFAANRITDLRPTVILVSIDGFRPDYLNQVSTPNLHSIMQRGLRAKYMIPSFPTKTFPNHYTLVTGLYPAHHGIVANTMYDPGSDSWFRMADRSAVEDARWWGGEPIWVTAEKQGVRTAPLLWPGAQAAIEGTRPSYSQQYEKDLTSEQRVAKLFECMDLSALLRPQLFTLYLEMVDNAGHDFGPRSPQVREAVQEADNAVGLLLNGLRLRGVEDQVNIIVVSDHGMAPISTKKIVYLDDYIDPKTVQIVDGSPVLSLRPKDGNAEALYQKLKKIRHAKAYLSTAVPERWHFNDSPRITPVVVVADDEWTISTRDYLKTHPLKGGNHGFDNSTKNMRAMFFAAGPSFQKGKMKPFPNIHIYSLLAYLLNVNPAKTDGSVEVFKSHLLPSTVRQPTRKQLAPWQKERDQYAVLMK